MVLQDPSASSMAGVDRSYIPLGAFCIIVGGAAILIARDYPYGTLTEMGPGFIPTGIAAGLTLTGILILALLGKDVEPADISEDGPGLPSLIGLLRAMFMILGSIVLFGLMLRMAGLAISAFLLVMIASYARRDAKLVPSLLLAAALSAMSCVLFVLLLGINVNILPGIA